MSFTQTPDPKKMQINLTGFLTDSTSAFMVALWNLLIEAQASPAGIPRSFVEEKKEEMRRAKEGDTRALAERDRRTRLDEVRGRERSERAERGGGRGRGRGRRGRGGIGNDSRPDNRTRDNGWSNRGGAVSHLPIPHTSKFLIFFHSSVRDIVLPAVRVRLRLGHGAGHRQVIALLARVVLPVALVLAVQFVHVRSLRLRDVDHRRRGARRLHHHAVAVAARRHTHLVTMSGIVGPEGATAAAHQRVADGSVRQHVAVVPVGAQTAVVAGAVQAPVALEGIVLRRANGHHHVGEEARGTGASVEAEAGAQRTEGKGHRVGVEAGLGVRARAFPVEKVGAKKET